MNFTIGIEEEYQIIDPQSRELTSYVQELLEQGRMVLADQIKPEFLQSQVEVGSRICNSVQEARAEIVRLRGTVNQLAERHGLRIAAASTHPFSRWHTQQVTAGERYTKLQADLADVARRMLIFGMHVHIGIPDRELIIDVMNQTRYFLPHLLALSTSSPFWVGRETGLKSYRSVVFESLPRTGIPPAFDSWAQFDAVVGILQRTGCIEDASKIWWDMRPHPRYGTLEVRVFDICTKVDECICLASLVLAITAKLVRLRRSNQSWRRYHNYLITENKWRAVRFGIEGRLIDFGKQEEVPISTLVEELLDFVDEVLDDLGCRAEAEYAKVILRDGTSAERQLRTFHETGSLEAVVDQLIRETREGW